MKEYYRNLSLDELEIEEECLLKSVSCETETELFEAQQKLEIIHECMQEIYIKTFVDRQSSRL